jgi:signal transduction histidine kinase/CheY-like chemotaxis protein
MLNEFFIDGAPVRALQGGAAASDTLALAVAGAVSLVLGVALAVRLRGRIKELLWGEQGPSTFPIRMLGASMLLTLASLLWMGADVYHTRNAVSFIRDRGVAAGELAARFILLDDSRSEALEQVLASPDAAQRKTYAADASALASALAAARGSQYDVRAARELSGMETAAREMLKIESAALALADQREISRARALLDGQKYQDEKRAFAALSGEYSMMANRFTRELLQEFSDSVYYTLILFVLSLPIQAVIWAVTLLSLGQWRRELVATRAAAEQASRSKGEFLANMSHELRTPMNGIIGLTQLLAEGEKLPGQEQLIDAVKKSSESLLFLLNDILDFSKIEAGQLHLEEAPFNLRDSLKNVIDLLSVVASKKGLVLNFRFAPETPACVVGDALRINQVVTNLVSNAIKFTSQGSVDLSVSAEPDADGRWVYFFAVADTGIGIPADKRDSLFRKFSQADASTSRKFGGTGLGLAISKMLAEKMGGRISFESLHGVGTIFTVTVALKPSDAAPFAPARTAEAQHGRQQEDFAGFRVLLVDDHPVNRLFAQKLLQKMGFTRIDEAFDGAQALAMIGYENGRCCYDMILMDCQMPEMDGFEAARRLRAREREQGLLRVPVIAMTAHAMAGDRNECLEAGMDDYISKPVNPDKLRNALCRQLFGSAGPKALPATASEFQAELIDIGHLELFTEGDLGMEKMMAEAFLVSGRETLDSLSDILHRQGTDDEWRKASHKLKGSSAQIGAAGLARLCLTAESGCAAALVQKRAMLLDIEKGFRDVERFFASRQEGRPEEVAA